MRKKCIRAFLAHADFAVGENLRFRASMLGG